MLVTKDNHPDVLGTQLSLTVEERILFIGSTNGQLRIGPAAQIIADTATETILLLQPTALLGLVHVEVLILPKDARRPVGQLPPDHVEVRTSLIDPVSDQFPDTDGSSTSVGDHVLRHSESFRSPAERRTAFTLRIRSGLLDDVIDVAF